MSTTEQTAWIVRVLHTAVPDRANVPGGWFADWRKKRALKKAARRAPPSPSASTPHQTAPTATETSASLPPRQTWQRASVPSPLQGAPSSTPSAQQSPLPQTAQQGSGTVPRVLPPPPTGTPTQPVELVQPSGIVSDHQASVANRNFNALQPPRKAAFQSLLTNAGSDAERAQLAKALASGHTIQELTTFAAQIKGKNADWMDANLKVAGRADGRGIQQQFVMSCPATTVQAARGLFDPIYALQLNSEGDISQVRTDVSGGMAAEQKSMLESPEPDGWVGRAVPLHGFTAGTDQGAGRFNSDLLNNMANVTGLQYTATAVADTDIHAHTGEILDSLRKGMPVPLVVGHGPGDFAHYVLATGVSGDGTDTIEIHDVGTGETVYCTADKMRAGTLGLPSGYDKLTRYEKPSQI